MHILVIGAGIIGMTSAYALARDGHAVTVVDGAAQAGVGTSRANGAQLSYSFVAPLADAGVLRKLPAWLAQPNSPLRLRLRADPAQWRWALGFLRACRRDTADRTTAELLQLGLHSRRLMHDLVAREGLRFDFASSGKLLVYQDRQAYDAARALMDYQASLGCEQQALDRAACLALEPALADIAERIVGGIYTPSEDAGDCLALCGALQGRLAQASGVRFHFGTRVERLRTEGGRIVAAQTSAGALEADGYVIANGVGAQALCREVGVDPLIYPLKGYSLTYTLTDASRAPRTSLSDVHNKVVYARLGNRLRVAGMVDIGARSGDVDTRRIAGLKVQVRRYLPRLNEAGPPEEWAGLRPARPDSKPLIGATPYRNLWINAGHGALGFTLAAGSAGVLADRIAHRPSAVADRLFML
ncbi:D-amino acid dehydrogenase [Achromobacter aloeverae]|uniref:D-amino acid dehydrogenase small subunit n=1 Tax=Achromobacter aloeverae TaxID=1750518 RepID=A0A4Q1HG08_9BURK|nr:D-amino acid dehydrogenase [Achromobacter aloeverae]RXN85992.1 D-amino acid dehydrogenase small subunit [Achromobacter aloeverae]